MAIIGYPSTRLIGHRPPIDADLDEIFAAAARAGTAREINSFPDRLDLDDELIHRARAAGVGSRSRPTRTRFRISLHEVRDRDRPARLG